MNARFLPLIAPMAALLLLTGCLAQSTVQYDYDVEKEECQDFAAEEVNAQNLQKGRSTALKAAFAECMRKQGWKLTTAKPPVVEPPIDAARSSGAINQAPPAEPQRQGAVQQSTTQPQPQGTPVRSAAETTAPSSASTYQPTAGSPQATGAQPGRYFGPR